MQSHNQFPIGEKWHGQYQKKLRNQNNNKIIKLQKIK